jgi:hypothetical protein
MRRWRVISVDRRVAFAGVALDLRDEYAITGAFGDIRLTLDLQEGADWRETTLTPVRNSGGIFVYTGIGRHVDPAVTPQFRGRVRIEAEFYRPGFQAIEDAIVFDVPTYNDGVPPAFTPLNPQTVLMLPTAGYPFPGYVRRIGGRVLNALGTPMPNALIEADVVERVISDERGAFTLPLRWQAPVGAVNVVVAHPRSGLGAIKVFNLPGDLAGNQDIIVT